MTEIKSIYIFGAVPVSNLQEANTPINVSYSPPPPDNIMIDWTFRQ